MHGRNHPTGGKLPRQMGGFTTQLEYRRASGVLDEPQTVVITGHLTKLEMVLGIGLFKYESW